MTPTANETLIGLLRAAAMDEHAAIIQYLRHAYMMGESGLSCEIEAVARDEMRHFWILSRWIVKLGGDPLTDRGFTDFSGATPPEWMARNVEAEDRAIAMYRDLIGRTDDADVRADIAHILADEERHRQQFVKFGAEVQAEMTAAAGEPPATAPEAALAAVDKEALEWGVQHEYAALLQYLMHSFLLHTQPDGEISDRLELEAVNEMQHLGWLGEKLAGHGLELPWTPHAVEVPADVKAMLQADVNLEQSTSARYGQFLTQMTDPALKSVVEDVRGQELYHESLFNRLLKHVTQQPASAAPSSSSRTWTIGSLKQKEVK